MTRSNPPSATEFELSVFGPGYGESIAIHIGAGRWVLVDSCVDPESKAPPVLDYLRSLGAEPAECVELVVATHWHDDHVRGISKVLRACASAEFACSAALTKEEFLVLTQAYSSLGKGSGVSEFGDLLACLRERVVHRPASRANPIFAMVDRPIHRTDVGIEGSTYRCELTALSPSDSEYLLAQRGLAKLLPEPFTLRTRLKSLTPNLAAVALWLEVGEVRALLGADLEETGDPGMGWGAIVGSSTRPVGQAPFFKVPHHGAKSSHHPPVWSEMLTENPIAALTPFVNGAQQIPDPTERATLLSLSPNCYSSADVERRRGIKRPKKVNDLIKQTVRRLDLMHPATGHIRVRVPISGWTEAPAVELFAGAKHLSDVA